MYYCPMRGITEAYVEQGDKVDHTHFISGMVSYVNEHDHEYEKYTSEQIKSDNSHIHFFRGETTALNNHDHRYCGYTGPAVYMPGGKHYHIYNGRTSYEVKHFHIYEGITSFEMPMIEV